MTDIQKQRAEEYEYLFGATWAEIMIFVTVRIMRNSFQSGSIVKFLEGLLASNFGDRG